MLERINRMIHLVARGEYPNCQQLAREMEFSARTLYRDIDFMRDRLGLPIEYDALRKGYYFNGEVADFPEVKLQAADLVALFVGEKILSQYPGTGLERRLRGVFERLLSTLDEVVSVSWQDLDSLMSFLVSGAAEQDIRLFETLAEAVRTRREIRMHYRKLSAKRPETRTVHPYHLASCNGLWYLIAYDTARNAIRTFALSRISHAARTGERFERPGDFDPKTWFAYSFGIFHTDGDPVRVRVRFDPPVSRLVAERQWHASQKVHPLADDAVELTLDVSNLTEVRNWIMSWGGAAEVLEPATLRDMVREEAARMARRYR